MLEIKETPLIIPFQYVDQYVDDYLIRYFILSSNEYVALTFLSEILDCNKCLERMNLTDHYIICSSHLLVLSTPNVKKIYYRNSYIEIYIPNRNNIRNLSKLISSIDICRKLYVLVKYLHVKPEIYRIDEWLAINDKDKPTTIKAFKTKRI